MKRNAIVFGCALALAATAPFATAAHHEKGHDEKKRMSASEKIEKMDTDDDGKVSLEEYRAAKEARLEKWFGKMDADGDGFVTAEELEAKKKQHCHRSEKKSKTE